MPATVDMNGFKLDLTVFIFLFVKIDLIFLCLHAFASERIDFIVL